MIGAAMTAHDGLARPGQTLIADKGYRSAAFETRLANAGIAARILTASSPSPPPSGTTEPSTPTGPHSH